MASRVHGFRSDRARDRARSPVRGHARRRAVCRACVVLALTKRGSVSKALRVLKRLGTGNPPVDRDDIPAPRGRRSIRRP